MTVDDDMPPGAVRRIAVAGYVAVGVAVAGVLALAAWLT